MFVYTGLVLGWLYAIGSIVNIIFCLFASIFISTHDGEYFRNFFLQNGVDIGEKVVEIFDNNKGGKNFIYVSLSFDFY